MNVMNAIAMRPTVMKVIPSPRRAAGTLEYAIFSLIAARVTIARNQPIPERASEDGAVHCDQREEDTQLRVQGRGEFLHHHFHYLGDGRHDCDEHDETEEAQVHIRKPGPCEGTGLQYEFIQQVVDRQCDQQHSDNSYSQTGSCLHIL